MGKVFFFPFLTKTSTRMKKVDLDLVSSDDSLQASRGVLLKLMQSRWRDIGLVLFCCVFMDRAEELIIWMHMDLLKHRRP